MTREEERLIWACALDLFAAPVLEQFVLESIRDIKRGMHASNAPRLVNPEGIAEIAGSLLDDIQNRRYPLLRKVKSMNREHLNTLMSIRYLIAAHVLMRVPQSLLTARLSEIRLQPDLGL